jgi:acyl-coenzyme A thioesterase PaaI-like protein
MSSQSPAIQDHYPQDFAHCYGCGRLNSNGLHVKSAWEGDEVVARFQPQPHHVAVPGFVYGGLLASLVDCHAMATAAAWAEREAGRPIGQGEVPRYVTASLSVDYVAPTPLGPELEIRARVRDFKKYRSIVEVSILVQGTKTVKGEVVAVRIPETMAGGAGTGTRPSP